MRDADDAEKGGMKRIGKIDFFPILDIPGTCWSLLGGEPGLSSCYHGLKVLPGYVKSILDGKNVKVPTMRPIPFGSFSRLA